MNMDPDRWKKLDQLFQEADEQPESERAAFLRNACGEDTEMFAELMDMLAVSEELEEESFLANPLIRLGEDPSAPLTGSRIGPYLITSMLGEGGMGNVYLASQDDLKRQVAIKVIRLGMGTRQVIKRFEIERQTLSRMNHPYIAHVYDAGVTDSGQPYFVMEYIRGTTITEYCDQEKLDLRARISLFIKVCNAIQYAHQKGIIHRDIKPANVLVTKKDDEAIPKVIDFGIAKATSADDHIAKTVAGTLKANLTMPGMIVGSLSYMSPEQANLTDHDVDTRTDVYSLGVLLYELLVGALPFDREQMNHTSMDRVFRLIREKMPPRPSSRLAQMSETIETVAALRSTRSSRLRRILEGDLDWMIIKALEKEKDRRYPSAVAFSEDCSRYLNSEPVLAGPPSLSYQARKFVIRYKWGVTAVSTIFLALLLGVTGTSIGFIRAKQAEHHAKAEAAKAQHTTQLMTEIFSSVEPEKEGPDLKVIDLLGNFSSKLEAGMAAPDEVKGTLHHTIGFTYSRLGLYEKGETHILQALEFRSKTLGPNHPDTLVTKTTQAYILRNLGRFEEAVQLSRETLKIQRRILPPKDPATMTTLSSLANTLLTQGKYDEVGALYQEVLNARKENLGLKNPATMTSMINIAVLYAAQGKYDQAEDMYRDILSLARKHLGEEHPKTASVMFNLAITLHTKKQFSDAEPLIQSALEIRRKVLGDDHHHTLDAQGLLASNMMRQGRFPEAEALINQNLAKKRRFLGPAHPSTFESMNNLGFALFSQGKIKETLAINREILEARHNTFGPDNPSTLNAKSNLAFVLMEASMLEESEQHIREVLQFRNDILGANHPSTLNSMEILARVLQKQNRLEEAADLNEAVIEGLSLVNGKFHGESLAAMLRQSTILQKLGQLEEAEAMARSTLDLYREKYSDNRKKLRPAIKQLIGILKQSGRNTDADVLKTELDQK